MQHMVLSHYESSWWPVGTQLDLSLKMGKRLPDTCWADLADQ